MARLISFINCSLDGFVEDSEGRFDWGAPDDEVHAFVNDLIRPAGTFLYGRRMYETMKVWENPTGPIFDTPVMQDFASVWGRVEKVVYSTTLDNVSTARTRLERKFDVGAVQQLKASAKKDLFIGGPTLASAAFAAGLVDEVQLMVLPVSVGGGKSALPKALRLDLELLEDRRFRAGSVFLRYRVRPRG